MANPNRAMRQKAKAQPMRHIRPQIRHHHAEADHPTIRNLSRRLDQQPTTKSAVTRRTSTVLLTKLLSVFGSNSSPNASNNSSSDPATAGTAKFNRTDPLTDTDPPAANDASVQTNAFTQLTPTSGEEASGNPEPSWLTPTGLCARKPKLSPCATSGP